jgi:hypothetical protein
MTSREAHRLVLSHDSHETVHGTGTIGRSNTWLAVKITKTVGSIRHRSPREGG